MPNPAKRVLVADDNPDAGSSLKMLLEALGHEVRLVRNGAAAVRAALVFRPEIAILDIGMPVLGGYEAARLIRAASPRTTLVALTGLGRYADRTKAKRAGFDHHMLKPLELGSLLAILKAPPRKRSRKDGKH